MTEKSKPRTGFGIVPSSLFTVGLKAGPIAIFVALATFADHERQAWPSIKTLGDMVGMKPRCVRAHLAELERVGAITRTRSFSSLDGRQSSNRYQLDPLLSRLGGAASEDRPPRQEYAAPPGKNMPPTLPMEQNQIEQIPPYPHSMRPTPSLLSTIGTTWLSVMAYEKRRVSATPGGESC